MPHDATECTTASRPAGARVVFRSGVFVVAYFAAHQLSFLFPDMHEMLMVVWPPGGIAIAALLLNSRRHWPAILVSLFIAGNAANWLEGRPLPASIGFMTANVLESFASAWFVTRICGRCIRFDRVREILALLGAATFVNAGTALVGAATATWFSHAHFWTFWATWWVSDGLGILLVTPVVIAWSDWRGLCKSVRWHQALEAVIFFLLFYVVSASTFRTSIPHTPFLEQPYVVNAMIVWGALRLRTRGIATALAMLSVIVVTSEAVGDGPLFWGGQNPTERLLLAQVYLAVTTLTGLILAAAYGESRKAEQTASRMAEAARESRELLHSVIEGTTDAITAKDLEGRFVLVNEATARFAGKPAQELNGRDASFIFPSPEARRLAENDRAVLAAGKVLTFEEILTTADGIRRTFSALKGPRFDARGNITGFFSIARDITEHEQMRRSLIEQRDLLASVIEGTNAGTWRWNVQTGATEFDERWAEIVGYTLDELAPVSIETWLRLAHPEDLEGSNAALNRHFSGAVEHYDFECRMRHKNGSWVWVHDRGKVVQWTADGKPLLMTGTHSDITVRRRAQEKLAESEANFRTFFESMTDMIFVASPDGRVLFTNTAASATLGYTADEFAAMHLLDVHSPHQRAEAEAIFAAMGRGERESCPLPLARKDGSLLPVETRAWRGRWNDEDCIFGICKNLTAEVEAQQRFERLFHRNPTPMALSSIPGRQFVDVNEAFMATTRYSREEVIGRTSAELGLFVSPEQQQAIADALRTQGSITNQELRIRSKDGSCRDGLFSGEIIASQGREYFLTVMVDITERKRAEDALRHYREDLENMVRQKTAELVAVNASLQKEIADRKETEAALQTQRAQLAHVSRVSVLGELATSLAHEINQPLAAISNYAYSGLEKLRSGAQTPGSLSTTLEKITLQARRAGEVIGHIRRFLHRQEPQRKRADINQIVSDAVRLAEHGTEQAGVAVQLRLAVNPPAVLVDVVQIEQVVVNLLRNAVEAMSLNGPHGAVLTVTTSLEQEGVRVAVADHGPGIDAAAAQNIFEPFFTTKADGLGMGLSISRTIVEDHGGRIWAGPNPDGGTVVSFVLPAENGTHV